MLEVVVAERHEPDEVAVVGREPIGGEVEAPHDADDRGLLAEDRRDRGDAALALQVPQPLRRPPGERAGRPSAREANAGAVSRAVVSTSVTGLQPTDR